ncbi:hypothetical protein NC653_004870 [Populus alba x Populus x berolinensis]|uniref:Uncharacterized protein n=1 Tax=Populus alba x Populus x berolinensis TaxID=444605 RepID=A0AAD6RYJ5_9ROSI|nr:hypothetical protein NC653_004870 [Populus alba x Populus x berolinensis]
MCEARTERISIYGTAMSTWINYLAVSWQLNVTQVGDSWAEELARRLGKEKVLMCLGPAALKELGKMVGVSNTNSFQILKLVLTGKLYLLKKTICRQEERNPYCTISSSFTWNIQFSLHQHKVYMLRVPEDSVSGAKHQEEESPEAS